MKNKIWIFWIIVFFLGISYVFHTLLNKEDAMIYTGIAIVEKIEGYRSAIVKVEDENNFEIGASKIHSNIFDIGDQVIITYTKKASEINIVSIKSIANTEDKKKNLAYNIKNDITLIGYRMRYKEIYHPTAKSLYDCYALPVKISGQYYEDIIDPSDYGNILRMIEGGAPDLSREIGDIKEIVILSDFEILGLDNVTESGVINKIKYTLEDNIIRFNTLKGNVYSLKVEYDNGDIINYLIRY